MKLSQCFPSLSINNHNQNRATDTQPIISNSQQNDVNSDYTILSHRTISDTYLNLSRKDIDDIMTALHTLAQHLQYDVESINQQHMISNRWFHHQDHIKSHRNFIAKFHHDLYDMKYQQKHRIYRHLQQQQQNLISYPSYSTNAIVYATPCKSNQQLRHIYHCSRQHQSTTRTYSYDQYQPSIKQNLTSSISLSSYILDQLVSIDQNEPILKNIQILPKQAYKLQILQNNPIYSFISGDSLNTKAKSDVNDRIQSNKIDVATQWSLQSLSSSSLLCNDNKAIEFNHQDEEALNLHVTHTNSNILTELTTSNTVVVENDSIQLNDLSNDQENNISSIKHNEYEITKSMTERLLTTLNLPTCKCSTTNRSLKHSLIDSDSSINAASNTKRMKQLSKKSGNKRSCQHSSKPNHTIKRTRFLQSNDRLMNAIHSCKIIDLNSDDSSFDFFDIDTTFTDAYDRLFTDTTTTSEKYIYSKKRQLNLYL
ncbi:hypothetical protein I4U23_018308 [Adineta vaga]|nr:hypothetical protein I4U23_018308 [Adineta vaga]